MTNPYREMEDLTDEECFEKELDDMVDCDIEYQEHERITA